MDCDDAALIDADNTGQLCSDFASAFTQEGRVPSSPTTKQRSLSDGGKGTPGRNPISPSQLHIGLSAPSASRDDSLIGTSGTYALPATPGRSTLFWNRGTAFPPPTDDMQLSQHQQPNEHEIQPPTAPFTASSGTLQQGLNQNQTGAMSKPAPLLPKLYPSQVYASPTNIVPRHLRGLGPARPATGLLPSSLAGQSSPDLSPIGDVQGSINIPGQRAGEHSGFPESSTSLWSMMGRNQDRAYPSSSLGSVNIAACSDSSSSSDEVEDMDEDIDEPFITTPQVGKTSNSHIVGPQTTMPWLPSSPTMNDLLSFTQRQRPRKQPKRKVRGLLGPRCTDSPYLQQQLPPRRDSISWAANQLHISGSESGDSLEAQLDSGDILGPQRGVVRRAVTRRGSLLVSH
ncbi:hypothetical protein SEPCBS119000_002349 [Sporothrix epigloea]|uniref:Uncharacterized protein n=1 Tax=Sporothrix epigloea TaxID=1892477 RepID=A0ABP0DFY3_9PEZI